MLGAFVYCNACWVRGRAKLANCLPATEIRSPQPRLDGAQRPGVRSVIPCALRDATHAITSGTVAGTRDGALVTFTLEGFTIQIPASPSAH
jgi:hypothetical protein